MKQSNVSEIISRVSTLVDTSLFGVLSTVQADGQPYSNLVAVTGAGGINHLLFVTLQATRKYENLIKEPRVSLLLDNRSNADTDLREAIAATFLGSATQTKQPKRDELAQIFLGKHPMMRNFVESPNCALFDVCIHRVYVVRRFQSVMEIHLDENGANVIDSTHT